MRPRRGCTAVIVASALALVAIVIPTAAVACPSLARKKSFEGTASVSFSQSATKEEYEPGLSWASEGTWHGSFNQIVTGLRIKALTPMHISSKLPPKAVAALGSYFDGPTTGGQASIENSLVQYEEGGAAGSETYSGTPGTPGAKGSGLAAVQIGGRFGNFKHGDDLGCKYVFSLSYGVSPNVLIKPSGGSEEKLELPPLTIAAQSPAMPITGLHLSGSAEIPDGVDIETKPTNGAYDFYSPAFVNELSGLSDGQLGNAVLRWDLRPVYAKSGGGAQ